MKNIKKIFIISFLLLILIYATNITSIPKNIVLFQGEKIKLNTVLGIKLQDKTNIKEYETVQASTQIETNTSETGKLDLKLQLFGKIRREPVRSGCRRTEAGVQCQD